MFRKLQNFLFGTMPNPADATVFYNGAGGFTTPGGGKRQLTWVIGNGTDVITTGVKTPISVPIACTITKVRILSADAATLSGAIVLDIWKDTYANFPPTNADSITAAAPPTITASANKSEDSTLTGWTTSIAAGDVLIANVDSISTFTLIEMMLEVQPT
jgi:hypothetical protein